MNCLAALAQASCLVSSLSIHVYNNIRLFNLGGVMIVPRKFFTCLRPEKLLSAVANDISIVR